MLTEVILENFKCFNHHAIPFRANTIIVGRNNAGKSTIIEAMRLVALVLNRLPGLHVNDVPRWLDIPRVNVGVSPSLEHQSFDFENVFHSYGNPPAKVTGRFDSGIEVVIYVGGADRVHAVTREVKTKTVISKARAKSLGIPKVGILPPIGPLAASEKILNSSYVSKLLSSDLASIHFRNQRKLIRFLRSRYPQVIVATHSVEIMSEVEPENILVVDREKQQAQFTTDVPAVQNIVDQIGGIQNLQLARLWGSHRCLFVEGKDVALLKQFQNNLHPNSSDPIEAIPSLSVGGWSGWPYAVGSSMLLSRQIGQNIKTYCILDSDFHTAQSIALREREAASKGINLHIWTRKELENYLIAPSVIHRVISRRIRPQFVCPTRQEVSDKIFSIAGEFEDAVMDAMAHELYIENKADGTTQANARARQRMKPSWDTLDGRFALSPGKEVLSRLSEWAQQTYKVSISAAAILNEMRANEIPTEVVEVITAIEQGLDLKDIEHSE
jgi:AAA ATPase-like protein